MKEQVKQLITEGKKPNQIVKLLGISIEKINSIITDMAREIRIEKIDTQIDYLKSKL